MSRDLPDRPHLDHLKKQAKVLLRELRRQHPDATLADALHALARDYGFASWPKLKAYVGTVPDVVAEPAPAELFPRVTEAAKRTLFFSRYEASRLGRIRIGPEHMLLGLIRGAAGTSRLLLDSAGVTIDDGRVVVAAENAPRDVIVEPVQLPFQEATKALFTTAAAEADRLGHQKIATVHVMLALLRDGGLAASFLHDKGMTLDSVRAAAAAGRAAAQDDEANS
jgi:hypothetical protein